MKSTPYAEPSECVPSPGLHGVRNPQYDDPGEAAPEHNRAVQARRFLIAVFAVVLFEAARQDAMNPEGKIWHAIDTLSIALARPINVEPRSVGEREKIEAIVIFVPDWAFESIRDRDKEHDLEALIDTLDAGAARQISSPDSRDSMCVGVDIRRESADIGFVANCSCAERYIRSKSTTPELRLYVEPMPDSLSSEDRRHVDRDAREIRVDEILARVTKDLDRYRPEGKGGSTAAGNGGREWPTK